MCPSTVTFSGELPIDDHELDQKILSACAEQVLQLIPLSRHYQLAREAIEKAVAQRAAEVVTELFQRPIQPVDRFGDPKGEPRLATDIFADAIEHHLATPVDREGKPAAKGSAVYTLGEFLLCKIACDRLTEAVTAEVRRLNAQAKENIRDTVAKAIAAQMPTLVGN